VKIILRGLGVATPSLYATQEEAYAFFTAHCTLKQEEQELYRRILLDGKIKGRYLGMDAKADALETDPDLLLARFLKFGRATAVAAARRALAEAGVEAADIAGLIVNTCTGYLCPGLTSYIAKDLGLKTSIRFQDLMGDGVRRGGCESRSRSRHAGPQRGRPGSEHRCRDLHGHLFSQS